MRRSTESSVVEDLNVMWNPESGIEPRKRNAEFAVPCGKYHRQTTRAIFSLLSRHSPLILSTIHHESSNRRTSPITRLMMADWLARRHRSFDPHNATPRRWTQEKPTAGSTIPIRSFQP